MVANSSGKIIRLCRIYWRMEPVEGPKMPCKASGAVVKDLFHACCVPISINVLLQFIPPFPPS